MFFQTSMSLDNMAALFAAMLVLALLPSVSVLTVSARSAAMGLRHGMMTTTGVVAGDIVFIVLAVYGLAVIAELAGPYLRWLKYLGGAYLIWLGFGLWGAQRDADINKGTAEASLFSSFVTGLLITLGDQKALLFYLGFFPAFVDVAAVSLTDLSLIIAITTVAVGGAKLGYAFVADRASALSSRPAVGKAINRVAAAVLLAVGLLLIGHAWAG